MEVEGKELTAVNLTRGLGRIAGGSERERRLVHRLKSVRIWL